MELEYAVAACANHLCFPLLSPIPPLRHIVVTVPATIDPRDDQRVCVIALMFGPRAGIFALFAPILIYLCLPAQSDLICFQRSCL
jgi:hypothetical protein